MVIKKQYTKEFKLDAVSLVLDQGYSVAEAARSLENNANMLRRWIKELQADDNGQVFRGNGKGSSLWINDKNMIGKGQVCGLMIKI